MNDLLLPDSWWLLSRARGVALLLRVFVLASPAAAVGCAWLAAGRTIPLIDAAIVALALVCTALPDSHFGMPVVLLVGIEWLATVHDRTSPWSVGAAISVAVFHTSMAAASVAPPTAKWTPAMCRRWSRRCSTVMVASAGTWVAVVAIHGHRLASSAVLIAAALVVLAIAGLWARGGSFDADPSPQVAGGASIAATRASTRPRS